MQPAEKLEEKTEVVPVTDAIAQAEEQDAKCFPSRPAVEDEELEEEELEEELEEEDERLQSSQERRDIEEFEHSTL